MTNTVAKRTKPSDPGPAAEIGLLIYPDCQLAAIYGLTDLFRIAGEWSGAPARHIRVTHWQATGDSVTCIWDSHPGAPHRLSHAITPPSLIQPDRMAPQPIAARWLSARHAEGATLCSVCAGAFVLAETGLIDGRRATTHWAFARQLAERFPKVQLADSMMVVDEGDILTAGGILAWADLGLTLVGRLLGPATMLATARFLLIEPPRHSQRPFAQFIPRFDHGDDPIRQVQHQIHAEAATLEGVADLAGRAGMTSRTFLRRFRAATGMTPVEYLQQVRIAKAREALERTLLPVDRIAWDVGYSDAATFRKLFQKLAGLPPAAYRQQFGIAPEERAPPPAKG
ncbi:GlxA family transcriptional regulator [Salipiger marinus]|uniref:Transcriptional regulator GlxA family, contains an amidase domain and an AraC-type DNA-binding HTH domain n=1 Tax=Salipiger marinus TaxID=555512 RepID=A0A1G8J2M6_9RHOB|nr:GlxA family transcriptional regulator [Salipiger marinus]SDI25446.1 Transcriptional regulator GlxA family, contains an amidase domain and an AraC-type DNA-binding HTH domain [Salipiger marinus]